MSHRSLVDGLYGYAAAWFDLFGVVDCHPFVESDGRVYLRIDIRPFVKVVDSHGASGGVRYNFGSSKRGPTHPVLNWLEEHFGGRIESGGWHATGPRAADCLRMWQPFIIRNRVQVSSVLELWDRRVDTIHRSFRTDRAG